MKLIFQKSKFSKAPGGDRYEWKKAETRFAVPKDGIYIIAITASARNGKRNGTGDDDDLRITLDGYEFGKREIHEKKTSWHGFGTSAAWDGASLKGSDKTVYLFAELTDGEHSLTFIADGKPKLKKIEVYQLDKKKTAIEDVIFEFNEKAAGTKTDKNGIPWKSFVFQSQFNTTPFKVKLIEITATCESAKQKGGTDGDNIKTYANGIIIKNPKAPTSNKYKNFFFSGDLSQGQTETLMLHGDQFSFSDSGDFSIELWYDESPLLKRVKIEIEGGYNTISTPLLDEWLNLNKLFNPFTLSSTIREAEYFSQIYAKKIGILNPADFEDSEVDACRHFCWSVLLTRVYNQGDSKNITTSHEIFWARIANKQELSRGSIMDLWNNKQGREYAEKYPDKKPLELFELALSEGKIVRDLKEVTHKKRQIIEAEVLEFFKNL